MESLDFTRTKALNNIPSKKLLDILSSIENSNDSIQNKTIKGLAINRYAESNIPIEYWSLKMESDFQGDKRLLESYKEYVKDLKASYLNGTSICYAGSHGVGKSLLLTCVLKKAVLKGYSCLYSTLSDIVTVVAQGLSEDKYLAKRELSMVDFLVIDEVDSRFIPTENAADLYARSLEGIFRTRSQNKLPTLMATNSPNIVESFNGALKLSIDSLFKGYIKLFPVFGEDFRKNKK